MNKKEKVIRENANKIRAEILGFAIDVEDTLTEAIGHLYTRSGSPTNLINDILVDLTFSKKINIFSKFVKQYPEFFSRQPNLIRDLNEIREKRNIIAHRTLSVPWMYDENDMDNDEIDYLTKEIIDWKTKCDFMKGDKFISLTLQDLENFKNLCSHLSMNIHRGFVDILNLRPKIPFSFDQDRKEK